jgi:hypothetical protein
MFHQKQFRNYCRCHAINNFLGYEAIVYSNFDNSCDEFDKKNEMPLISKSNYYFYNNGGNNNIFGHIFKKLNFKCKLETIMNYKTNNSALEISNINIEKVKGFIIFNNHHTWCIRKHENKFFIIDSLSWMIKSLNNNEVKKYLMNQKGIICIN